MIYVQGESIFTKENITYSSLLIFFNLKVRINIFMKYN